MTFRSCGRTLAAPPAILASSAVAPAPLPTDNVPAASAAGHPEPSFAGGVVLRLEGKVDAAGGHCLGEGMIPVPAVCGCGWPAV
jgi:hypothetical protein